MEALWTIVAGALLIAWTLLEVFSDLFQPSGSGSLSSFISRRLFAVLKHWPSKLRSTGPLTIVVVISCWAMLTPIGFGLLYWHSYPGGFSGAKQGSQGLADRVLVLFYFSLGALTTLGSGRIQPEHPWIRLTAAFESLIGISLITASITWIVLIYPALARMRLLTRKVSVLMNAQNKTGVNAIESSEDNVLGEFTENVIRTHSDFIHFPIIYYFQGDAECMSLGLSLEQLFDMTEDAADPHRPDHVRLGSEMLRCALDQLASTLSERFLKVPDATGARGIFEAAARDHLRQPASEK